MIFCGQCGLQLTPGTTTCPRCGTIVEESKADIDALHTNDQTIAGQSISHLSQAEPITPGAPPQQLVLRPGTATSSSNPQDATSMIEVSPYGTNMPPGQPTTTQYPTGGQYPTQASYANYSTPGSTYAPAGMSSPAMTNQMQQNTSTNNGNPTLRVAGLIIVFFGVLLMIGAVILFMMQQSGTL